MTILDPVPIPAVFVGSRSSRSLCYEVGFRIGRWWQDRMPGEQEGPTEMLVGSLLALMAFLLAVTMGMAADRFDARRGLRPRGGQRHRRGRTCRPTTCPSRPPRS